MAVPEALRFDGDAATVTGAGTGLGHGYALELAGRGAAVLCNDVVGAAAQATVDEIGAFDGAVTLQSVTDQFRQLAARRNELA